MASICDGGCRPYPYVLFEEPLCSLVGFRGSSTSLPGGKGLPLVGKPDVALDRGEADVEEAGGLGLGDATLLDSLDYLLAQVFGVGFHHSMIAPGSSVLI